MPNKKNNSKIVFIHQGYNWFLPYALNQASSKNPDNVILLTDEPISSCGKGIQEVLFDDCIIEGNKDIESFKENYQHMSTNSVKFELFCWLRWFHLLNLMKKENLTSVFYLDTDVLLYSSANEMLNYYSDNGEPWCGFSIQEKKEESMDWTASGHTSYWTIQSLEEFCQFIIKSFSDPSYLKTYEEKWLWHQKNKIGGGICDMTTLFLFWKENPTRINNFAKAQNGAVIDHNVNLSSNYSENEYIKRQRIKSIKIIDGLAYFQNATQAHPTRALSVHFQGGAKKFIAMYYNGSRFYRSSIRDTLYHIGKSIKGWIKSKPHKRILYRS